jgi:hypothetical protein
MTKTKHWIGMASSWLAMIVGIAGLFFFAYSIVFDTGSDTRSEGIIVTKKDAIEMTIEGDTSRKIYVIQDSTNGLVWIGVSGRSHY